jgi:hypothetical protein
MNDIGARIPKRRAPFALVALRSRERRSANAQLPTQNVNVVLSVTEPDVALMYVDQTPPMKK